MKRVILSIPAGQTFDGLTADQRAAIQTVGGQYTVPMPGTQEVAGRILVDAVTYDSFDPANLIALGLDWTVLGLWQWSGTGSLSCIIPLNTASYLPHMTTPSTEPHAWSGWPSIL